MVAAALLTFWGTSLVWRKQCFGDFLAHKPVLVYELCVVAVLTCAILRPERNFVLALVCLQMACDLHRFDL